MSRAYAAILRARLLRVALALASLACIAIAASSLSAWVEDHLFLPAAIVLLASTLIGFACAIHEATACAQSTESTQSTAPATR